MSESIRTAKVKLVTVVVPYERSESITRDIKALGITGYTSMKADGRGHHGSRRGGFLDSSNIRFEVLAEPGIARKLLEIVAKKYEGDAVVAFMMDVEAVPYESFI